MALVWSSSQALLEQSGLSLTQVIKTQKLKASIVSGQVGVPLARAEVEIEESSMKYFPIYGTTPRELQASILANGPFNEIVKRNVNASQHACALHNFPASIRVMNIRACYFWVYYFSMPLAEKG